MRSFSSVCSFFKTKGSYYWKHNFYRLCVRNPTSGLLQIDQKSGNDNDVTVFRHDVIIKFFWHCFVSLVKFSYWSKIHVNISTGSGIITISFYKGSPEIRTWEIPTSEFCSICGDWEELCIPNLAWLSLIECYWMLQNSKVTAFTIFELLKENQLGGKITPPTPPTPPPPFTQIRVN